MTEKISLIISVISIIVAVVAVIVSVKAWRKNRAIYGIEREVVRQFNGTHDDLHIRENRKIAKKLESGNYTILSFMERKIDKDWEVMLGRITPNKKDKQ